MVETYIGVFDVYFFAGVGSQDRLLIHALFYFGLPFPQLFEVVELEGATPHLGGLLKAFDPEDVLVLGGGNDPQLPKHTLRLQFPRPFVDVDRLDVR